MTFIALLLTLMLEQLRPMSGWGAWGTRLAEGLRWVRRRCETGAENDGVVAFVLVVAPPAAIMLVIQWWFLANHPILYIVWAVFVLYLTMGFRQFSGKMSAVLAHLEQGHHDLARQEMIEWTQGMASPSAELNATPQLISAVLYRALVRTQHHVFSPFFWVVIAGPVGPLIYRWSYFIASVWPRDSFGLFSHRVVDVLEWLPTRVTGFGFALMGNFYEAIRCWRTQAAQYRERSLGVLMASSAGALDIVLHGVSPDGAPGPLYGSGDDPREESLREAVALVWRTLVFLMVLTGLLTLLFWWGRLTRSFS